MSTPATTADLRVEAPRAAQRLLVPWLLKLVGVNSTVLYGGGIVLLHHVHEVPAQLSWIVGIGGFVLLLWTIGILVTGRGLGFFSRRNGRFRIDWLPVLLIVPIGLSLWACLALGLASMTPYSSLAGGATLPLMLTAAVLITLLLWRLPPWPAPSKKRFLLLDLTYALTTFIAAAMLFSSVHRALQPAPDPYSAKNFHHVPGPNDALADEDEEEDECIDTGTTSPVGLQDPASQSGVSTRSASTSPAPSPSAASPQPQLAASAAQTSPPQVASSSSSGASSPSSSLSSSPTAPASAVEEPQAGKTGGFGRTCIPPSTNAAAQSSDDDEEADTCVASSDATSPVQSTTPSLTTGSSPSTSPSTLPSMQPPTSTAQVSASASTSSSNSTALSASRSPTVSAATDTATSVPADTSPVFARTCTGGTANATARQALIESELARLAPVLAKDEAVIRTLDDLFSFFGLSVLLLGGLVLAAGRWLALQRRLDTPASNNDEDSHGAPGSASDLGHVANVLKANAMSMAEQDAQQSNHPLGRLLSAALHEERVGSPSPATALHEALAGTSQELALSPSHILSSLLEAQRAGTSTPSPTALAEAITVLHSAHNMRNDSHPDTVVAPATPDATSRQTPSLTDITPVSVPTTLVGMTPGVGATPSDATPSTPPSTPTSMDPAAPMATAPVTAMPVAAAPIAAPAMTAHTTSIPDVAPSIPTAPMSAEAVTTPSPTQPYTTTIPPTGSAPTILMADTTSVVDAVPASPAAPIVSTVPGAPAMTATSVATTEAVAPQMSTVQVTPTTPVASVVPEAAVMPSTAPVATTAAVATAPPASATPEAAAISAPPVATTAAASPVMPTAPVASTPVTTAAPVAPVAQPMSALAATPDHLAGMQSRLDQHEQAATDLQNSLSDVGARLASHEAAANQLQSNVGAMQDKMEQHAQMLNQMAQHMQDSAAEARKTSDSMTRMMLGMKAEMDRMSKSTPGG